MIPLTVFDSFPRLSTARLELRPITQADAEALFAIYADPETMRYWSHLPYTSIDQARALIDRILTSYSAKNGIEWAITERGSDQLIGKCCYHRVLKDHFRAEVGYVLARDRWGQGILREALLSVLDLGFSAMGLHSVEAQLDPRNERSANALEKVGFKKEGHLRESFFLDGKFSDTAIYSLLKREHLARR
jgi:ribosomal-protein-alanine N-acetyltransferase